MNTGQFTFSRYSSQLRAEVLPTLAKSPLHPSIEERFDNLIYLADKFVLATAHCPEATGLRDQIDECLAAVFEREKNATPLDFLEALQLAEPWLKAILWAVDRQRHARLLEKDQQTNKRQFNLYGVIQNLKLLTNEELEKKPEDRDSITDLVKRAIFATKEDRNAIHESRKKDPYQARNSFKDALVTLFGALDQYRLQVAETLKNFVVRNLELSESLAKVLGTVRAEHHEHISAFKGRQVIIDKVVTTIRATIQSGGYLLYTAQEGFGKSALAAQTTKTLSAQATPWGDAARSVIQVAPWLGGSLFHTGKQSKDSLEITCSLITQANVFFLNPEPLPDPLSQHITAATPTQEEENKGNRNPHSQRTEEALRPLSTKVASIPLPDILRRSLYSTLQRLSEDRGSTVVFIDALDEITSSGEELSFLPRQLPPGIVVVLTSRPNPALIQWIKRTLSHVKVEQLPGLTLEDTTEITGEQDSTWNSRLCESSEGSALVIREKAQALLDAKRLAPQESAWKLVDPSTRGVPIYEHQAAAWRCKDEACPCPACAGRKLRLSDDPLQLLLELFAAFEPISSLSIDQIQGYLEHRGHSLRGAEVLDLLKPVGLHLVGLSNGPAKLGTKALADYVWKERLSIKDRRSTLSTIVDWLGADHDVDPELLAQFIEYWVAGDDKLDKGGLRHCARRLLELLGTPDRAFAVAECIRRTQSTRSIREGLLRTAASGNIAAAQFGLARLIGSTHPPLYFVISNLDLIQSYGLDLKTETFRESIDWLKRAAEQGHAGARLELAVDAFFDFLSGTTQSSDQIQSELQALHAEGNNDATVWLALFLLELKGKDAMEELYELLVPLCPHNTEATALLSLLYLDGVDGEGLKPREGLELLQRLRTSGKQYFANWATEELIHRLLDGDGTEAQTDEGLRLLREMAETGDDDHRHTAMFNLAERYLDGEGVPADPAQGLTWMHEAMKTGAEGFRHSAALAYAERLLDGDGVPANMEEGLRILKELTKTKSPVHKHRALSTLADRFLDGEGVEHDEKEGLRYLRQATQAGTEDQQHESQVELAERLLDGLGVHCDELEGLRILKRAAESKDLGARGSVLIELGSRYLDGMGVPHDAEMGVKYLHAAAQVESAHERHAAIMNLSIRLLEGDGLTQNIDEGLRLFREANQNSREILKGNANLRVATVLLSLSEPTIAAQEGLHALLAAVESKNRRVRSQAKLSLGCRLIDGDKVPKDVTRGISLVQDLIQTGDAPRRHHALKELARRKLDAIVLPHDQEGGLQLLRKACTLGPKHLRHAAQIELAERLLDGKGCDARPEEGLQLLTDLIRIVRDSQRQDIIINLGLRHLEGRGVPRSAQRAQEYFDSLRIRRNNWSSAGYQTYKLATTIEGRAQAGQFFFTGVRRGETQSSNNLAYMVRRGEFTATGLPSLAALLKPGLRSKDAHALMNEALRVAIGVETASDWAKANELVRSPAIDDEVLDWWHDLAKQGDAEGHLVVGWLVKHGKARDPDGLPFYARFDAARSRGLSIPDWLYSPYPPGQQTSVH